jgi:hypothetical protein
VYSREANISERRDHQNNRVLSVSVRKTALRQYSALSDASEGCLRARLCDFPDAMQNMQNRLIPIKQPSFQTDGQLKLKHRYRACSGAGVSVAIDVRPLDHTDER